MATHLTFLITLVALLSGAWSLTMFHVRTRRFSDKGLALFWWALLSINLLLLRTFLFRYMKQTDVFGPFCSFIEKVIFVEFPIRVLFYFLFYLLCLQALTRFMKRTLPLRVVVLLLVLLVLTGGLYLLVVMHPAAAPLPMGVDFFWIPFRLLPQLLAVFWMLRLRGSEDGARPKPVDAARRGVDYFIMFLAMEGLTLVFYEWGPLLVWEICERVTVVGFNLGLVHWLVHHYLPSFGGLSAQLDRDGALAMMRDRYALTAREMDVLQLLVDGRTYKEIEDLLFISLHTVKRHVYNVYKKAKVGSRHQLIHLVTGLRER